MRMLMLKLKGKIWYLVSKATGTNPHQQGEIVAQNVFPRPNFSSDSRQHTKTPEDACESAILLQAANEHSDIDANWGEPQGAMSMNEQIYLDSVMKRSEWGIIFERAG